MSQLKTLNDVAHVLGNGGPHAPNQTFKTVRELVNELVAFSTTESVYAQHDEHLGLMGELSEAFLGMTLEDADRGGFAEEHGRVLAEANRVIELSNRNTLEDDDGEMEVDDADLGTSPDR